MLLPILKIIKKHNIISGTDLQKEMNMKSSSNLSNFFKRIDKYKLVNICKIGTSNYISLTSNGEKLLSQNTDISSDIEDSVIKLTQLYYLLDALSHELLKKHPSTVNIMHNYFPSNINIKEKRLLKQKIDCIFINRDEYVRSKFKNILVINKESYSLNEYGSLSDKQFYELKKIY